MKMAAGIQSATATKIKQFVMEGYSANLKLSATLRRALTKSGEKCGAEMVDISLHFCPDHHGSWSHATLW
jgi:hypothetical protein